MDIRFISSLTSEDEARFAPALLKAMSELLDQFPITYSVRIETAGGRVLHHPPTTAEVVSAWATPTSSSTGPAQLGVRAGQATPLSNGETASSYTSDEAQPIRMPPARPVA